MFCRRYLSYFEEALKCAFSSAVSVAACTCDCLAGPPALFALKNSCQKFSIAAISQLVYHIFSLTLFISLKGKLQKMCSVFTHSMLFFAV